MRLGAIILAIGLAAIGRFAAAADRFVLVGIDHYAEGKSGMQDLNGSRDALAMKAMLIANFGVAEKDIVLLLDRAATKAAIERSLEAMVAQSTPGDRLFFYYSGHGTTVPADLPTKVRSAILPYDAVAKDRVLDPKTLVTGEYIRDQLRRLKQRGVRNVTLIFDSCDSGAMTRGPKPKGISGIAIAGAAPADLGAELELADFHFIGAAKPGENAWELMDGSGVLTKALIEGIRTWAASSVPGEPLDFRSLGSLVGSRMRELCFEIEKQQTPSFFGDPNRAFLSAERVIRQPSFTLSNLGGKLTIDVGRALGVRERHVFAVYKRGARVLDTSSQVAAVEVVAAREFDCEVRPVSGSKATVAELAGCPAVVIDARGDAAAEIQLVGAVPDAIRLALGKDPLMRLLARSSELLVLAPSASMPNLFEPSPNWRVATASGRLLDELPPTASSDEVANWIFAKARSWSLERALMNLASESPEVRVEMQIVEAEVTNDKLSRILPERTSGEIRVNGRFVLRVRATGPTGQPFPSLSAYLNVLDLSKNAAPSSIWPDPRANPDPEGTRIPADGVWRYLGFGNRIVEGKDLRAVYVWKVDPGTPSGDEFLKLLGTQEYVALAAALSNARGPGETSPLGQILRAYKEGRPITRSGSAGQDAQRYAVATTILRVVP